MQIEKRKTIDVLLLCMWMSLVIKCIATAWGCNYLYADGANFCYSILRVGNGVSAVAGRQGSFLLMELPMVIALKLGVTNISVLCALFGIGSVIWFGLFIALAMHLCKKYEGEQYIAGAAILYAMVNIFTGFFTQIESITAVGIFTYLFFYYLLARKNGDRFYRIVSTLLLMVLPNANEYFVGYAIVLILAIVLRIIKEQKNVYWIECLTHIGVLIWTIYQSYYAILHGNATGSLMGSIQQLPQKRYYWLLIALISLVLLVTIVYNKWPKKPVKGMLYLAGVSCCVWLAYVVLRNPAGLATASFSMRAMNLVLPMGFTVLCLGLWWFDTNIKSLLSLVAMCFLFINSVYTVQSSGAYHDYLVQLQEANEGRQGFYSIDETNINRTFMWGWPLPMEGILAQCIQGGDSY